MTARSLWMRRASGLVAALLLIEFLDEFVFGAREAAWPFMRRDIGLSYAEIGLLLGIPGVFSGVVEPALGVLSDIWNRRAIILGGGVLFAGALLIAALSQSFIALLIAFVLLYPASGAFVSLSQATLMDAAPDRREHNMARWTLAGSVGMLAGPLALSGSTALGMDWRGLFVAFAALTLIPLAGAWRQPLHAPGNHAADDPDSAPGSLREGLRAAWRAVRQRDVLRWLVLLQFGDLMLDILYGFLALYFVDVAGVSPAVAGVAVAIWAGVGLLGDALLIPLIERVPGVRYLRLSALAAAVVFPAFLLIEPLPLKLGLLGALGLLNAGWYAIPMAQLYATLPNQSGAALAAANVSGLGASLLPLAIGAIAQAAGLDVAIWLLMAGPLALLIGLPRHAPTPQKPTEK